MPSNIRKSLLQFVFSGANMKRWNDKLRPTELLEVDKQAHKMIAAWLLCRLDQDVRSPAGRLALEEEVVEGGIFDYLFRLIITDIKPPVLYRIKKNPEHYQSLAKWAVDQAEPLIRPLGMEVWERFERCVRQTNPQGRAAEILAAAHLYASMWEFRLLRPLNDPFDTEMEEINGSFITSLTSYSHLQGVPELLRGFALPAVPAGSPSAERDMPTLARFANLCGQLRFQKRWSQTPRIPETSVMGHMFLVACYAYFLSWRLEACPARRVNNFFTGLFHDLPEVLTRDIISPVKRSFDKFEEIIRQYEGEELKRRVFAPLDKAGYDGITRRLAYYLGMETGSEFHESIVDKGKVRRVDFASLQGSFNSDEFDPKDGEALKICDTLAAYIEAYTAMRNGIASDHIQKAFWRTREQYASKKLGNYHIGTLFTDFD